MRGKSSFTDSHRWLDIRGEAKVKGKHRAVNAPPLSRQVVYCFGRSNGERQKMKLSLESGQDDFQIRGYGREGIRVGERTLTRSFILSARGLIEDWPPVNRHTLRPEHLQTMVDLAPEVVIIGIGERLEFPPPEVLRPIVDLNVGVEVMSTDAACRTYNVLHGEDRHVVAGFLIET